MAGGAERAEDERQGEHGHDDHGRRSGDARPQLGLVAFGGEAVSLEIADVSQESARGQAHRLHERHAEHFAAEAEVLHGHRPLHGFDPAVQKQRFPNVLQDPAIGVVDAGVLGPCDRAQQAIVAETEQVDAAELELRVHPLQVEDDRAVLDPRGAGDVARFLPEAGFVAHVAREVVQRRPDELADQRRDHEQHESRHRHHGRELSHGVSRRSHDDELAAGRQAPEAQQGADQYRDRQHLEGKLWQPQRRIQERRAEREVALDVVDLPDELEQRRQREQHAEHEQRAQQDRAHQVGGEDAHHRRTLSLRRW